MHGRSAFGGRAFLLGMLLHLAWRPVLAPAPAEEEGGGCTAGDETSRLQCQLNEARALIEEKDAELARKEAVNKEKDIELERKEAVNKENSMKLEQKEALIKEKDVELGRKEAMNKEKDAELARKDAVLKAACKVAVLEDMEAQLARKEDKASAMKDAMIKDEATAMEDAMIKENATAVKDAMIKDEAPVMKDAMMKDDATAMEDAMIKDMETQLARKEAQDSARALEDAMTKDDARGLKDATIEDEAPSLKDAMLKDEAPAMKDVVIKAKDPDLWPRSRRSRHLVRPQEQRKYLDPWRRNYLSKHMVEQEDEYPDLQRDSRFSEHRQLVEKEKDEYPDLRRHIRLGKHRQLAEEDRLGRLLAATKDLPTIIAALPANTTIIELPKMGLTGTLPAELGRFLHLEYVDLSRNNIRGSLPAELGNLVNLRRLHLYTNPLTGTIPPQLGKLTKLDVLSLENCGLTGTIPPELSNLTQLQYWLDLSNNKLTGTIPPELGTLTGLSMLQLNNNGLTGAIPPELGKLTWLTWLILRNNVLAGTIFPPELYNLTKLERLVLDGNRLTGTVPPELGRFAQLGKLEMSGNQLTGTIPPELGKLTQLQSLNLQYNDLTGTIPLELFNLTKLTSLLLDTNRLTGTIPPELGNLVKLTQLYLGSNRLYGTIPPELGKLTKLQVLDWRSTDIAGSIPTELGNLVNLNGVSFAWNQLTGTVPPELGRFTKLGNLDLSGNHLTGTIPPGLYNMTKLEWLQLNNNMLTGTIPPELGKLPSVTQIHLGSNGLAGTIPPELYNSTTLEWLLLDTNRLTGTIPPELGNLTHLARLVLNDNELTGTIPPELGKLTQLWELDLSGNWFTGTVPHELGSHQWQKLSFAGNDFTGTLPEWIGQSQDLVYLDVSDNPGFTGTFPDTMNTNLPAILASNCNFTSAGAVAPTVRKISFAHNHLTEFPEEWVNLPLVLELDVSNNHIGVWRPYGVLEASTMTTCGIGPLAPRFDWPAIQSVKLSGNPFGPSITLRDFLWSLAYVTSLSELFAAGCLLHGVFPDSYGGIGTDDEDTGDCSSGGRYYTGYSQGFRGLLTLDLSDNNISAILPAPPPRLYTADLHSNLLEQLHDEWYSTPRIVKVWNNSLLRAKVVPPSRATRCPTGGTPSMEADPFGFITTVGEDAFECTALCVSVTSRYEHDASLNVSSLCRCTAGRQGAANNCSGCPADTYSHHDAKDKSAMVRTCRPCPEHSSTENVDNATSVDQCKCQAGWYMQTPSTGDPTPACKRCSQRVFMDTVHGATQEEQCFCNTSYDGLRALQGHCGCADGSYMDNLALVCRQCDAVAEECTWGSTIELSLLPPVIKASYWAAQPPEVGPEEVSTFSRHDIWRCYSKDTCLRNGTCAVGRSGTACSLCDEGMYGGPDGPCTACPYNPEEARKNLCYALLIGPAAAIAAHTLLSFNAGKLASAFASLRTSGKQSLKYLQMLGVMAGFNIDWPPLAYQFITSVARITVALPQVAGVACLTGRQTATLEMGFRWLMPVAGLLSACLGPVVLAPIRVCFRKSRFYALVRMSSWDVLRVSLWGLVLFYSTLLQFGTQVLACVPSPNGMRTVATFPHLQCGATREWTQLAGVSVAFLLLFVGAVFLSIYAAWRRATHALVESKFQSSGWWGFIFDDYRGGSEYWLMVTMAKDAALVVIATAGASDGPSQLLATAAVSTMYSYVVLRDQPFRDTSNSLLEAWTMMSVAVISVFTAGMGFQSASGVADVTELFSDGAADPEYKKRERALLVVQCLTFVGPAGIILYQLLCALDKVRKRLPAFLRPSTKEEREEWNAQFITSLNLNNASAPVLWGVMDQFDMVDNARFRDLMTTSMATLDIIPNNARSVSIKRMVRKRLIDVASAAENRKVAAAAAEVFDAPDAPLPPPPADLAEDEPHGPGGASIGTDLLATLDVPVAFSGDSGGAHAPTMLLADGHAGRLEYL